MQKDKLDMKKVKKELDDIFADHKPTIQRGEIMPTEDIKKLQAEVGNLKVQNADYSQIVGELSDKLKKYENKYGTVFTKGSSNNTK
jgi:chaperonin cofactor prefoldin|tara:strand:+ start:46 stop:303 length:258 start_codon:yes stop_codon:yes gene_type:complete